LDSLGTRIRASGAAADLMTVPKLTQVKSENIKRHPEAEPTDSSIVPV
jgi:hypothetical protein